ncbi:hypothetical protein NY409_12615, partial [Enterobacter hormaechei]|nr:hypothetical protein [Enterobacter hormaechei]
APSTEACFPSCWKSRPACSCTDALSGKAVDHVRTEARPAGVAGNTSWSGFRPDMINRLAAQGVSA